MYYIFEAYEGEKAYALFSDKRAADKFVEEYKHWMEVEWGEIDETSYSLTPIPHDNPDFNAWLLEP